MEQYVTYHKILDFIKNYQEQAVGLNSFGHGDLVYFATTNSATTVYPLVFVTPQQITYDENITQYQLSIIFGDIVNTDLSNQEDVLTDMSIQAKRFISQFKRGQFIEKMDITLPVLSTPFIERFNDHIGGVVLDCQITVFEDLNACDYYEPSPTPTSSPTSTPTPTPTATPSPTPTPILQQYLKTEPIGSGVLDSYVTLSLYSDSGFTTPTNAICNYSISGTCTESGVVFNQPWTLTFPSGSQTYSASTGYSTITDVTTTSVIPSCGGVNIIY